MRIKKCPSTKRLVRALELLCSGIVFSEYKKRPLGLILLLVMILMGFEVGTKKPLCISSKIVNKIDRVSLEDASSESILTETLYSCSNYKIPRFSTYFYENLGAIDARLHKIERAASLLGLMGRVDIEINETTTGQLKLKNNKIAVSADRLEDPELEKLFVTVLLLQNMKFESAQFAGFLAGWLTGHAATDSAVEEIWYDSFESLNTLEQFNFRESVFAELRKYPDFPHKSLLENIQTLLGQETNSVLHFKSVFNQRLQNLGAASTSPVADLIFENKSDSDFDSASLLTLAKSYKAKRVVFEEKGSSYVLPFMTKMDSSLKAQLTTPLRVLLVDTNTKLNFDSYLKNTERLIVFKTKAADSQLKFSGLFVSNDVKKNELAFLNANKGFDVIQFHIPTFKYTKAQMGPVKDYFGLLKKAKSFAVKKMLGWESEVWSIEAQAFKPVAVYDVIQYYRIN